MRTFDLIRDISQMISLPLSLSHSTQPRAARRMRLLLLHYNQLSLYLFLFDPGSVYIELYPWKGVGTSRNTVVLVYLARSRSQLKSVRERERSSLLLVAS